MKKYFSILMAVLLAALMLSLTSCSDDEEEEFANLRRDITGTWQIVDGVFDEVNVKHYLQFRNDGSYYEVKVWEDEWSDYFDTSVEEGTWALEGRTLYLSNKRTQITVKEISQIQMIFEESGHEYKMKLVFDGEVNKIIEEEGY